ncbi:alpha/beta hydrolase [Pelomonas sp. V22]|uniref:alpha/beta fold hydrolase n=1 Tax=Pelomonas sp. V22 TaxID=2822139 RepID=UPI0024A985CB|nr:alpha/beta hydrolase [Pelomonas sp. V22]MDI4634577.1 alpha/beta hydrolase [Pelomonas sp. V22]
MKISSNGLQFEVLDEGPRKGPPLLMIMGLGMQLIAWPEGLVQQLIARGFRVIRFDNRDIGLSSHLDEQGLPNLGLAAMLYALHLPTPQPAYTLRDMAVDALGLLDALQLREAHVLGASMGGMIAQHLALIAPDRIKSLSLMMTSSGSRRLPGPSMKLRAALLSRPARPDDLACVIDHMQGIYRLIGSPAFPAAPAELRARVEAHVQRSHHPRGVARQLAAVVADSQRAKLISQIRAPTHIIHGKADPLVPPAAAPDLQRRIAGATLDLIDGMGHDLPEPLWPRFVAGVAGIAGL